MLAFPVLALLVTAQAHQAHGYRPPTGRLLVVGGSGGIPDIQQAVDEACDGDAILVKQGDYPGFIVADKALSIVADWSAAPSVHGPTAIRSLSAGKSVLLAGLTLWWPWPALAVEDDSGSVRLEECTITSMNTAVLLDHAADVALVMCTLRGGDGQDGSSAAANGQPGLPALSVLSSSVALRECALTGGRGGRGFDTHDYHDGGFGGAGGDGVIVTDGFVYTSGSEIRAGDGGAGGDNYYCTMEGGAYPGFGGPGGSGLHATNSVNPPDIVLLGTLSVAGAGGPGGIDHTGDSGYYPCFGDGNGGADGSIVSAPAGAAQSLPGAPRRMIVPRVARESEGVVVAHCYGRPNDVVQIFASNVTQFAYEPSFAGVQLIALPNAVVVASGTIPMGGSLDLEVPLGSVERDAKTVFLQAYFRATSNQRFAATQSTILTIDPTY
jgi:hypothetical protein